MQTKRGFTLIELLVVATIIATLLGVASVSYIRATQSSRDARRKTDLEQIRQALETYRSQIGSYPTSAQGTSSLAPSYITQIPSDPKTSTTYTYTPVGTPPLSYTLCASLESIASPPTCNYSVTNP